MNLFHHDSNLRSPMLNSLREWDERRSTRVFREKAAKNASSFEPVCTVTFVLYSCGGF